MAGVIVRTPADRVTLLADPAGTVRVTAPLSGAVRVEGAQYDVRRIQGAVILLQPAPQSGGDASGVTAPAAVALEAGQPVYITSAGTLDLAGAAGMPQAQAVGLALASAATGAAARYASDGSIERADWRPVAGTVYLIAGAIYYLGSAPGTITTRTPTGSNSAFALPVGFAVSASRLDIEIGQIIQLIEE